MWKLAYGLRKKDGGNHKRRTQDERQPYDQREMSRIFGDWWTMKGGLETLPQERAVEKIIDLLRHPAIDLNPLARAIMFALNIPPPQLAHLFTAAKRGHRGSAQRVAFFFNIRSGRVLDKIPGSRSGRKDRKGRIGYFRVSFLLSGISGYVGYFWVYPYILGLFFNIQ